MADLVEKVARAIYDELEGPVSTADFGRQMRQWDQAQSLARAAITAMSEAGGVAQWRWRHHGGAWSGWYDGATPERQAHTEYESRTLRLAMSEAGGEGWQTPEGWRLVPVEPTPDMMAHVMRGELDGYRNVWPDVLEAAPAPPAKERGL